ncbi:undecaprenyl-phosphate galactose phosphotransferase WbaP [Rubripirellula amarantea]|uniref:UDP-glucose:undecaprenyl-phosphate glucose-1-phosphate transferase n=1 Tax=Rubripirellula amarantea TaxID=2527999 RepID=A0A5C5WFV5_9BACT|nr:undecaprenyl-phosphate galactose phosphotransferase WbaP [Rubripirellula amarantea]MDA8743872.1 undecaprenyl-phosphate galactose phosphotransferase WbaP [Rubripirellula amarantea]TWT49638.1 UDP-glucose:undecaprenyl-phosphate glucose-1-phosphate transferase [Rubripirellula amarantea]
MSKLPVGVISADAIEPIDPISRAEMQSFPGAWTGEYENPTAKRIQRPKALAAGPSGTVRFFLTAGSLLLVDAIAIVSCLAATAIVMQFAFGLNTNVSMFFQSLGVLACYFAIGSLMGLFPGTAVSPVLELRQLVRSCLISCALVLLLNKLFATLSFSELVIGTVGGIFTAICLPFARTFSRYQLAKFDWWGERAIIIGAGPQGRAIYNFHQRAPQRGLRPIGLVDFPQSPMEVTFDSGNPDLPYLGSVERISRLAQRYRIRWGIVAPAGCDTLSMNEVMKFSADLKNLLVLPSPYLLPSLWSSSRECAGVLGVHVSDHLRSPIAQAVKKLIDWVVAFFALIVLAPIIGTFVLMIKRQSPGPAFYGHERIGRGGKKFKAWKLRTMVTNADQVLEQHLEADPVMRMQWIEDQKLKNDPRIIPKIGHFLRKTSLDELPQLFNVLKGEMSIVGPRPIVTNEIGRYGDMYPLYLRVVPGITGLWQVSGRNDTSYDQRVRLDSYYVCNWSVWLDAYIVVRTFRTLLLREGAY